MQAVADIFTALLVCPKLTPGAPVATKAGMSKKSEVG